MKGIAAKYRNLLQQVDITHSRSKILESAKGIDAPKSSFSNAYCTEVLERSKESLYHVIEHYFDNSTELQELADRIFIEGGEALRAVIDDNDNFLEASSAECVLEVIVNVSGSRPSFLINNGAVDLESSPVGCWEDVLNLSKTALKKAIACVGRIDINGRHIGTGFLIGPHLIVTNLHVLQAIGVKNSAGEWELPPLTTIDFGYEYKGQASLNKRHIDSVVFANDKENENDITKRELDLALLSLKPAEAANHIKPLQFKYHTNWLQPGNIVFIAGYPADPGIKAHLTYGNLLNQLFKETFGYKRLAPGRILPFSGAKTFLTFAHDATTLGGNSGSPILEFMNESNAVGLHFGGSLGEERRNFGHILGNCLNWKNTGIHTKTLEECLEEYQVAFS